MSLRGRLLLTLAGLLAVALVVSGGLVVGLTRNSLIEELDRELLGARAAGEQANDVQRQLADNLRSMIELWRARPEHQVLDVLEQSRSVARDAAQQRPVHQPHQQAGAQPHPLDASPLPLGAGGLPGMFATPGQMQGAALGSLMLNGLHPEALFTGEDEDHAVVRRHRVAAHQALLAFGGVVGDLECVGPGADLHGEHCAAVREQAKR